MNSKNILVIDVGGTHVKLLATGQQTKREFDSGPDMTPDVMMAQVKSLTSDWQYDVVTIGFPAPVRDGKPAIEPHNLGSGWVGFDFEKAVGRPVRVLNDAAMQALGDYHGGRMLFLGFGTGLGSALIVDNVLAPLELGHLPYRKGHTYEDYVGLRGLERMGKKKWRRHVEKVTALFRAAFEVDDIVLGGGNAKQLKAPAPGTRLADNNNAFLGGFQYWD
ncbi:MAG: ROK family protein [Gemmatimonadaceae bacterium]